MPSLPLADDLLKQTGDSAGMVYCVTMVLRYVCVFAALNTTQHCVNLKSALRCDFLIQRVLQHRSGPELQLGPVSLLLSTIQGLWLSLEQMLRNGQLGP